MAKSIVGSTLETSQEVSWDFNLMELATYEEARALRELFNHYGTGGGVLPGDDEKGVVPTVNPNFPWLPATIELPGIYQPSWVGGPAGFPIPQGPGGKKFLHFRFKNGGEGMNVGLCIDKFKRYPTAPLYVINTLNEEANNLQGVHG